MPETKEYKKIDKALRKLYYSKVKKVFAEFIQAEKEEVVDSLYKLDWIIIMRDAIEMRPSSWNQNPIREWRNSSDEVCSATIGALRKLHNIKDPLKKALEEVAEYEKANTRAED